MEKSKFILLTEDETANILVALTEFEVIIEEKPRAFGGFKSTNSQLIEKVRNVSWSFLFERKK